MCLNLMGQGQITAQEAQVEYAPLTAGFYCLADTPLRAMRAATQRHQFITLELAPSFLKGHLSGYENVLHPLVQRVISGSVGRTAVSSVVRLTARQQEIVLSLRKPPVFAGAQVIWFQSKAFELVAEFTITDSGFVAFTEMKQPIRIRGHRDDQFFDWQHSARNSIVVVWRAALK